MKTWILLAFTVLLAGASPAAAETALQAGPLVFQPSTAFDTRCVPGGFARMLLKSSSPVDSVTVICMSAEGKTVSRGTAFPLNTASPRLNWGGIIGLPSTISPGLYRLVLEAKSGGSIFLQDTVLEVNGREFLSEEITLNETLTTLRTEPDPKKVQESKELAKVLATPHADALHETGLFLRPVDPVRTSSFYGDRRQYRYSDSKVEISVHYGMDYALPDGKPVAACGAGRVVLSADRIMSGNTVIIEHMPGVYSIYYHMSERLVRTGDVVERGGLIGKVGHSGLATGPHLHWEVQISGVAVDPEAFFTASILDKSPVFDSIFPLLTAKGGE